MFYCFLQQTLLHEDPTEKNVSTRCLDIVLRDISSIAAYEHEYAGVFTSYYHITFTSDIGPSKWQATIDGKGSIQSVSIDSNQFLSFITMIQV